MFDFNCDVAQSFGPYNINENTITGYAGNDASPDEEVVVGIASVPGSTPSVTGGSDTFEAQLILDNVVNSGILKTEEEVVSDLLEETETANEDENKNSEE